MFLPIIAIVAAGIALGMSSSKSGSSTPSPTPSSPKLPPNPVPRTWRAMPNGNQPTPTDAEGKAIYAGTQSFLANVFEKLGDQTIALAKVKLTKVPRDASGAIDFGKNFEGVIVAIVTDYEAKGRVRPNDKLILGDT